MKIKHNRKLTTLGIKSNLILKPEDVVFNRSSYNLSRRESSALALGLDFGLPITSLNKIRHFLSFEKLINFIQRQSPYNSTTEDITKSISNIATKSFKTFKKWKLLIPPNKITRNLTNLFQNKNIVITKPDKGRGIVLLDKSTYIQKVQKILADTTKFRKVTEEPIKIIHRLQLKLNNFISKLVKTGIINRDRDLQ